jgi:hypothetical protein
LIAYTSSGLLPDLSDTDAAVAVIYVKLNQPLNSVRAGIDHCGPINPPWPNQSTVESMQEMLISQPNASIELYIGGTAEENLLRGVINMLIGLS